MTEGAKKIFVFIGPPGSGKGSLSARCVREFGWVQLSTGNLCRRHIAQGTEIGKEIAFAIKSGKLISDSLISSMVEEWLSEQINQVSAIILDGFPRAVAQAQALDTAIKEKFKGTQLSIVKFSISDDQVIERLTGRIVCKNGSCQAVYSLLPDSPLQPKKPMTCDMCDGELGQRDDDALTAVRDRLAIYHKHTDDLLQYYIDSGHSIIELDAARSLEQVFDDFKQLLRIS